MFDRRTFLTRSGTALGAAALTSLINPRAFAAPLPFGQHFRPKARRVIYLFLAGGPSHIDMFDYKPALRKLHGTELPDSIRGGQRITGRTSGQKNFPCVAPMFEFKQFGKNGTWVNADILPHTGSIIDKITLIKSINTESVTEPRAHAGFAGLLHAGVDVGDRGVVVDGLGVDRVDEGVLVDD